MNVFVRSFVGLTAIFIAGLSIIALSNFILPAPKNVEVKYVETKNGLTVEMATFNVFIPKGSFVYVMRNSISSRRAGQEVRMEKPDILFRAYPYKGSLDQMAQEYFNSNKYGYTSVDGHNTAVFDDSNGNHLAVIVWEGKSMLVYGKKINKQLFLDVLRKTHLK